MAAAANLPDRLVSQRQHAASFTAALTNVLKRQSAVSRTRLAAYLARPVSEEDALAALTLFMYGWRIPVAPEHVPGALRLLADIAARAITLEADDVRALFRHRVARSLRQQAELQAPGHRGHALGLFARAVRWDPGVMIGKDAARLVASLMLPVSALDALRRARQRSAPRRQRHRAGRLRRHHRHGRAAFATFDVDPVHAAGGPLELQRLLRPAGREAGQCLIERDLP